jgi:hypothetical protein
MTCPSGCAQFKFFENSAVRHLAISIQPNHESLCDPLPTGQLKRKNQAEIGPDLTVEKHRKEPRQPFDRPFELGLAFVFNKTSMGVGSLAEGRRQRAGARKRAYRRDRRDRQHRT